MSVEVLNEVEVFATTGNLQSLNKVRELCDNARWGRSLINKTETLHPGSSLGPGSFRLYLLFFSRGEMPSELIELLEDLELDFSAQEFHPTDNMWHSDAELRADMKAEEVK